MGIHILGRSIGPSVNIHSVLDGHHSRKLLWHPTISKNRNVILGPNSILLYIQVDADMVFHEYRSFTTVFFEWIHVLHLVMDKQC